MTLEELRKLVSEIRSAQSESDTVEVKTARGGTQKRLYQAISGFANRTRGGIILFGLDESTDFSIVGVGNAHKLQEEITSLASDNMEPAIRPEFTVDEIDDETVVASEIDEVSTSQKPCFYKTAGLPKGAYLRVGNTNRRMTEYEVFGYLSGREQPTHDEDTALDASLDKQLKELEGELKQTKAQLRKVADAEKALLKAEKDKDTALKKALHAETAKLRKWKK